MCVCVCGSVYALHSNLKSRSDAQLLFCSLLVVSQMYCHSHFVFIDTSQHLARVICMLLRQRRREKATTTTTIIPFERSSGKHTRFALAVYQYFANAQAGFCCVLFFVYSRAKECKPNAETEISRIILQNTPRKNWDFFLLKFKVQLELFQNNFVRYRIRWWKFQPKNPWSAERNLLRRVWVSVLPKCSRKLHSRNISLAMNQAQSFFGTAV